MDQKHRLIRNTFRCTSGWQKPTSPSPHTLAVADPATLPNVVSIPPELRAPVLNQGQIGRCTCETLGEILTGIALRDGKGAVAFSHNAPYWWARKTDGNPTNSDVGSSIATVMTVAQQYGVPLYNVWPDDRDFTVEPDAAAYLDASERKALLVFALPTIATIKASIRDGFAVAIGFACPADMFADATLNSGDINYYIDDSHYEGDGHAVSVWGCDDSRKIGSSTGALFVNCHWGTGVGQNGMFWLPYDFLTNGRGGDAHSIRITTSI